MSAFLIPFLWLNAALYAFFGLFCLVRPQRAGEALGFSLTLPHGLIEFLTVYGGMQLGFAAFFAFAASRGEAGALWGLYFALFLYGPIALVRWASILAVPGALPKTSWALAALELSFLVAAGALAYSMRHATSP